MIRDTFYSACNFGCIALKLQSWKYLGNGGLSSCSRVASERIRSVIGLEGVERHDIAAP